jgi:medium-chain acyl-[acyl-carrier-protein] hydrolase
MMSMKSMATTWFTCPKPNPKANLRLFCFPYAGGSAAIFHGWSERLAANVEVYSAQLPGRGPRLREAPLTSLTSLIDQMMDEFRKYLDRPFALFGHSMGALISFELARQLRKESTGEPIHLFASGRRAPHLPDPEPPSHNLPEAEFLAELHRLNGTPKQVLENPELMQLMMPVLRADFAVCETYAHVHQPPLSCPLTVFGGLQDEDVGREYLEPWAELVSGPFSLRMLPGDHFFIHSSEQLLLRVLYRELHMLAAAA